MALCCSLKYFKITATNCILLTLEQQPNLKILKFSQKPGVDILTPIDHRCSVRPTVIQEGTEVRHSSIPRSLMVHILITYLFIPS